ncbi:hypothetical protein MKX01_012372 [Papaver californicum]|nr:hypothetical protein MKX01_012372 [Papaver californicum]
MEKFDFIEMLKVVQKYKVTYIPVSPPLVIAMAKLDVVKKFDLSSLQLWGVVNLEAKIVDPVRGEALSPGQQGELWLRGPIIMSGDGLEYLYLAYQLKTGDLCYFDSKGYLFVVDRLKELIKYKAYQVPPAELEHLLQSHPEILMLLYPDEDAGQIPMAYIVRQPGSNLSEAQVKDFTAKQVAPYKKIRKVAFISAIPKCPAGKILRELVNLSLTSARL